MIKFNEWVKEPENKTLLEENNVPVWIANQIWDAAKVAAADEYVDLLHKGVLCIKSDKHS